MIRWHYTTISWGRGLVLALFCAVLARAEPAAEPVKYNRDIRQILSDNCFFCHGPDKNQRKAKMRLDVRESAIEKGAIVPGKPEESELIARIFTDDEDDLMPPEDTHKKLTVEQKELFRRWIADGAEYEPHWAYIAPDRPEVPQPQREEWLKNQIDAFVLRRLEAHKLQPSPEADRRALLRRLSLDLIGLPPTPEEVEAFLRDKSPGAYERQVDRLLASPHFGERMAVGWLDVVRYADTVGYHGDQNQNIFPYRDYVINAFNRNKPFDEFTIEQLAGDLLPNPSDEQRIATGFNRLNMMTREGGAQPKEYLAKYQADRVRTVSSAWLGSTMACAECHDHKYDPFLTKDFYQLSAFFADIKQWGVYHDYNYTPNPDLKGWSNDHPWPPEMMADSPYLKRRMKQLEAALADLYAAAGEQVDTDHKREEAFERWRDESEAFLKQWPDGWATPEPSVSFANKDTNVLAEMRYTVSADQSILIKGKTVDNTRIEIPLPPGRLASLRLELIPHEQHDGGIMRDKAKNATFKPDVVLKPAAKGAKETRLNFFQGEATHKEERYANGSAIIGVEDAWKTSAKYHTAPQTAVWQFNMPVEIRDGDRLVISLGKAPVGCVRVSVSPFAAPDPLAIDTGERLRQILGGSSLFRSKADRAFLDRTYLLSTARDEPAFAEFQKLRAEWREGRGGRVPTMITGSREPMITRVLPRGNWQDDSGEIVEPAPPHFLPQISNGEDRRLTRLDLARWVVAEENPLTARTFVNRLWKQFFGNGLSAVVDDLGAQGEWPTHPELLDWLAVEFRESGWDTKRMVKLMVMSSTYRQASNPSPELLELDPANHLLAVHSPRRLEAEFVRDNALFIAGLLNEEIGGPSARPYQPDGYYAPLQFPNREYEAHRDERQYRRGVYMHWQRTFLHPMLANFDAQSREECVAYRTPSNTPQQGLTLLNDPTFVEAARVFAANVITAEPKSDGRRLNAAFERALARSPKAKEAQSLRRFLAVQREHYQANPDEAKKLLQIGLAPAPQQTDPAELAAWTSVCRVILNLHETITRY